MKHYMLMDEDGELVSLVVVEQGDNHTVLREDPDAIPEVSVEEFFDMIREIIAESNAGFLEAISEAEDELRLTIGRSNGWKLVLGSDVEEQCEKLIAYVQRLVSEADEDDPICEDKECITVSYIKNVIGLTDLTSDNGEYHDDADIKPLGE